MPHSWSLITPGRFFNTRTVADAARACWNVLRGLRPSADPACQAQPTPDYITRRWTNPIKGPQSGRVSQPFLFERNQERIERAVEQLHRRPRGAGASASAGVPGAAASSTAWVCVWFSPSSLASPTVAYHDARRCVPGRTPHFQPDALAGRNGALRHRRPDHLKAEQYRAVLVQEFRTVFESVDVVLGPTTPITASGRSREWTASDVRAAKQESVPSPRPGAFATYPHNLDRSHWRSRRCAASTATCGFPSDSRLRPDRSTTPRRLSLRVAHARYGAASTNGRHSSPGSLTRRRLSHDVLHRRAPFPHSRHAWCCCRHQPSCCRVHAPHVKPAWAAVSPVVGQSLYLAIDFAFALIEAGRSGPEAPGRRDGAG